MKELEACQGVKEQGLTTRGATEQPPPASVPKGARGVRSIPVVAPAGGTRWPRGEVGFGARSEGTELGSPQCPSPGGISSISHPLEAFARHL